MNTPTIYLAGGIAGRSYNGATGWRERVARALQPDIIALSPMRAKHYLVGAAKLNQSYEQHPLSTDAAITQRDRFDVTRADAILFNFLDTTEASRGTLIEFGWASALGQVKPLIVACEQGNIHDYCMIRALAGFVVPTLAEAVEIARAVLLPGVVQPRTPDYDNLWRGVK